MEKGGEGGGGKFFFPAFVNSVEEIENVKRAAEVVPVPMGPGLPLGREIPPQPPTASQRGTSPPVLQIARGRWGNSCLWEGVCGNTSVPPPGCLYPHPFAARCSPRLSNWQHRKKGEYRWDLE